MSRWLALFLLLLAVPAWAGMDFSGTITAANVDYANCGSGASLDNITALTVAFWMKADADASSQDNFILDKAEWDTSYEGWSVFDEDPTANKIGFRYEPSNSDVGRWNTTDAAFTDGTWTHIAVTFDATSSGNDPLIYVNGTSVGVTETDAYGGTAAADESAPLIIAGIGSNPLPPGCCTWDGELDEIAVWNTILTAAQIERVAVGRVKYLPLQIAPSSLKFYAPMDDQPDASSADGDTITDRSGNGNNCTGVDGGDNTGLTWTGMKVLSYP